MDDASALNMQHYLDKTGLDQNVIALGKIIICLCWKLLSYFMNMKPMEDKKLGSSRQISMSLQKSLDQDTLRATTIWNEAYPSLIPF
jgi:hypothetical protein